MSCKILIYMCISYIRLFYISISIDIDIYYIANIYIRYINTNIKHQTLVCLGFNILSREIVPKCFSLLN